MNRLPSGEPVIVHLECGAHWYGGARQVLYLLQGLSHHPMRHVLVVNRDNRLAELAAPHAHVVTLPMAGDHDLLLGWRLWRVLRRHRAALLHVHSRRGAEWHGLWAARRAGCPAVLHRRVDNRPAWATARLLRHYDRLVAISTAVEHVLLEAGVPPSRLRRIPSAYAPLAAPGPAPEGLLHPGGPHLAMVAQFIPRKGHAILLHALPQIMEVFPDLQLYLFGSGTLEGAMQTLARELQIGHHVHFCGFRNDLPAVLPMMNLVVHPAEREGLGIAVLEAQALGVPVVASRAGGLVEAVADGQTGVLVPHGDIQALAAAIVALLGDEPRRVQMGQAGRRWVQERFSVAAMAEATAAVYDELLPGGARRATL
jgi:glycosyltransferase involved in cell wall biosynthesis